MLGRQSDQRGLWEADSLYLDHVGRGSFYGLLALMRGEAVSGRGLLRTVLCRQRQGQRAAESAGDRAAAADLR